MHLRFAPPITPRPSAVRLLSYDDRIERPGAKFKDADLIGLPLRLTIGARLAKEGVVEVRERHSGQEARLPPAEVVPHVQAWYTAERLTLTPS